MPYTQASAIKSLALLCGKIRAGGFWLPQPLNLGPQNHGMAITRPCFGGMRGLGFRVTNIRLQNTGPIVGDPSPRFPVKQGTLSYNPIF